MQKDDIENKVFDVCCSVLESRFIPAIVDTAYKLQLEELGSNITVINLLFPLATVRFAVYTLRRLFLLIRPQVLVRDFRVLFS